MKQAYEGVTVADVCEARFPSSGLVSWVGKRVSDTVKIGEVIASLDKKLLQMELDRQLTDYEKMRAEFEIAHSKQNTSDEFYKHLTSINQSRLNISVKDVELAKYKMEQVSLVSPVNGVILEMEGLRTRMNVTPASNPVKILDTDSLRFSFDISVDDAHDFRESKTLKIQFKGVKDKFIAKTSFPLWVKNGLYIVHAFFENSPGLLPGMTGYAKISQ